MIMDAQLLASDGQAITATALSTNAIDLGSGGRDLSRGEPVRAVARAMTAFAGGASIRVDLVESDNPDLSGSSVIFTGPTTTTGAALAGASLFDAPVPKTSKRYVGFNYAVTSGPMTAGSVTSGLVLESDSGAVFPAYTGR